MSQLSLNRGFRGRLETPQLESARRPVGLVLGLVSVSRVPSDEMCEDTKK